MILRFPQAPEDPEAPEAPGEPPVLPQALEALLARRVRRFRDFSPESWRTGTILRGIEDANTRGNPQETSGLSRFGMLDRAVDPEMSAISAV